MVSSRGGTFSQETNTPFGLKFSTFPSMRILEARRVTGQLTLTLGYSRLSRWSVMSTNSPSEPARTALKVLVCFHNIGSGSVSEIYLIFDFQKVVNLSILLVDINRFLAATQSSTDIIAQPTLLFLISNIAE